MCGGGWSKSFDGLTFVGYGGGIEVVQISNRHRIQWYGVVEELVRELMVWCQSSYDSVQVHNNQLDMNKKPKSIPKLFSWYHYVEQKSRKVAGNILL